MRPQKRFANPTGKHACRLDRVQLEYAIPRLAPFAPVYKRLLYGFKKWLVVSYCHPYTKMYFRSNYAVFNEKARQLKAHKYRMIIHPLSRLAIIRQMTVCLMLLMAFIIDPLHGTFMSNFITRNHNILIHNVQLMLNCGFILDIAIQFFIGFTKDRTKEIILDHRSVIKQYLSTYFVFDLIPVVYIVTCYLFRSSSIHNWLEIGQLYCFRFVRLGTMSDYFMKTMLFFNVRESIAQCINISLVMLLLIHWWTCALYFFPTISYFLGHPVSNSWVVQVTLDPDRKVVDLYIECLLCTVCHFFGAGKGLMNTENEIEQIVLAMMLMCGVACHIYVIAVVLQLFGTINVSESKYEELIYQLNEYMVTKKLPPLLRKRLYMYYEYKFQKQFFLENLILSSLSEHLRFEVILYSCRNLIDKVKMFQGAPKEVIGAIVSMLKHEIFLPNDIIVKTDGYCENIYFISFGTVCTFLPNGQEVFHLEDGHHFGEPHVIVQDVKDRCFIGVIAIEITEVFYLTTSDFWYLVSVHPDIAERLQQSAAAKLQTYREAMNASSDSIDPSDVLLELRKGHILERGRRRH